MAGGIQPGTVATDAAAAKLDKDCRFARDAVFKELKKTYPELVLKKKLDSADIPGGIGACSPDGGAWFYKGKLIAAVEGKKQQDAGNAIERWYKNNFICRKINPEVSYITFCSGEGSSVGGVVWKALHIAHFEGGMNMYVPGTNSVFYEIEGHTRDSICAIIKEAIIERIQYVEG